MIAVNEIGLHRNVKFNPLNEQQFPMSMIKYMYIKIHSIPVWIRCTHSGNEYTHSRIHESVIIQSEI